MPPAAYVLVALFMAAVVSAVRSPDPVSIAIVVALVVYTAACRKMAIGPDADGPAADPRPAAPVLDSAWHRDRERRRSHR